MGMKPNEHEYKVMGLSGYSNYTSAIEAAEKILFEALDFRGG
jgi:predicted NodU family carbamoyl transferase